MYSLRERNFSLECSRPQWLLSIIDSHFLSLHFHWFSFILGVRLTVPGYWILLPCILRSYFSPFSLLFFRFTCHRFNIFKDVSLLPPVLLQYTHSHPPHATTLLLELKLTFQCIIPFVLKKYCLKILAARCLLRLQCIEEHSRYVTVRGFLEKWTLRRHGGGRLSEDPGLKCQLSTIAVDRRALHFAYI